MTDRTFSATKAACCMAAVTSLGTKIPSALASHTPLAPQSHSHTFSFPNNLSTLRGGHNNSTGNGNSNSPKSRSENTSCYYSILGTHKTATSVQIQKAYRRKAVQTHPDKTGNRVEFDLVSEAYDVLSDDNKRSLYDRYGKKGIQPGANMNAGSFGDEMFRSFFGNSPFSNSRESAPMRNANVKYQVEVTLEDLYKGVTKNVNIQVTAPGSNSKKLQLCIEPGMKTGSRIVLHGEMDYSHGVHGNAAPGDVIFILHQKPHALFTRKGSDLAMECEIGLRDAICGFHKTVTHLDGREINMKWEPTENLNRKNGNTGIARTGDVFVMKGEGMPKRRGRRAHFEKERGDLYVQVKVRMPGDKNGGKAAANADLLTQEERDHLGRLLDKLDGGLHTVMNGIENKNKTVPESASVLEFTKPSKFGQDEHEDDEQKDDEDYLGGEDEDDEIHNNPFFGAFSSSSQQGRGFQKRYYSNRGNGHSENVQCQQM